MHYIKYLPLIGLLFSHQIMAFQQVDLPTIFPNVIQGHDRSPDCPKDQLTVGSSWATGGAEVNGTKGELLYFCSRASESDYAAGCDNDAGAEKTRTCDINGIRSPKIDLTLAENAFKETTSTGHVDNCPTEGVELLVGEGEYDGTEFGTVDFGASHHCTLKFSSNHAEYLIKSIHIGGFGKVILAPGDYYFEKLELAQGAQLEITGDTRVFIKNKVELGSGVAINTANEHKLYFIVYHDLTLLTNSTLGALAYADGLATIGTGATFNGRISADRLIIYGNINNTISLDDPVDTYEGPFQFGKISAPSLGGEVTFPQPFDKVPKVFLMPTITPSSNEYDYVYGKNPDGSATATITEVTKEGFKWQVERPIYNTITGGYDNGVSYGCKINSTCQNLANPMEVHWIAATEGKHTLPDGKEIVVGSVRFKDKPALGMKLIKDVNANTNSNQEPLSWIKVEQSQISKEFSVVLNSRQAKVNDCFLTSIALPIDRKSGVGSRSGTYFMLDTSNATVSGRDNLFVENSNCLPPLSSNNVSIGSGIATLAEEEIAYLATKPGVGEFTDADGSTIRYEFGSANTSAIDANIDAVVASPQNRVQHSMFSYCNALTPFSTAFDDAPTFIASKVSANNNNTQVHGAGVWSHRNDYVGGFLRRCQLTKSNVSMVNDEVYTFYWTPRWSFPERYAFVALEKVEPPTCFIDEFDRTEIGEDWVTTRRDSNTTAIAIVDGRLRLTDDKNQQATAATYQRLYPAQDNLIEVEFDYFAYANNSNRGDGIAVVFSDSEITPKTGAFGGALGYAQLNSPATNGFAGGWLGIGLDTYGNYSKATEGRDGQSTGRANSVVVRASANTNPKYHYVTRSAALSPALSKQSTTPAFGHRYKFTIDSRESGTSFVIVERDSGSGFQSVIPSTNLFNHGQTTISKDLLLSLTASTGGAKNYHEIDNFKVCALRSTSTGQLVHHFEFEYSDTPSTCAAETVKITACRNADCTLVVDEKEVTATLEPINSDKVTWSGSGVNGNTVTFSGGSTTIYLNNTAAGKITFGVTASTPGLQAFTSYDGTLCKQGAGSLSSAACTVEFKNTALVLESFNIETAEIEGDINGMIANKVRDVVISAYKEKETEGGDSSEVCEAAPLGTKNMLFWSEYDNPNSSDIIGSPQISVTNNTGTIQSYTIGNSKDKKTSIPIAFNDQGAAKIKINYPDAGKVQLSLELVDVDDKGNSTSYEGSGLFVSFPAGLCLTLPDANSACESNDATCSAFKAAGDTFKLQVQAKAWQNDNDSDFCDNPIVTPNYQQAKVALTHALVKPDPGEIGKLSTAEYTHYLGNATSIPLSISEVGVFTLQAKPPLPYLDSNYYDIPQATSTSIGRFYPHRFSSEGASISHHCSDFSYMGQAFTSNAFIKALNVNGEVTQNYQGSFAKSSLKLTAENNNDGVDLSDRIAFSTNEGVRSSRWVQGQLQLEDHTIFKRHEGTLPDGNYSNLAIGLQIIDGPTLLDNPLVNPNTAGDCGESCNALLLGDNNDLRYGRVKLTNTYGSSHEVLQMPAHTEYWNVNNWKINDKDSCTEAIEYPFVTIETDKKGDNVTITRNRRDEEIFNNGKQILHWEASSPEYQGTVPAKLAVPEYLQWYWDGLTLSDPEATATFGRYRGHNKIIYRTEERFNIAISYSFINIICHNSYMAYLIP